MVLVLRPGALGDTLLAVPALRALRARYGTVTLAAHGAAARLLHQCGEVDQGLAFDDRRLAWLYHGPATEDAIGRDADVVAWTRSALSVPGERVATQAPGRSQDAHEHTSAYLLRTLPFAAECDMRPLAIAALRSDDVLVHPGSGAAAKNWPAERYAETIRRIEGQVRLIVGEADEDAAHSVEVALGDPLPRLDRPSLAALAARLAGCRAYLGNDSGVSHLAGLCGARTVVMFGPTPAAVWAPLGPRVLVREFATPAAEIAAALNGN